jgi:hypothetical protein
LGWSPLKLTGVGITAEAPFQLVFAKMKRLLDDMEAILKRNPGFASSPCAK